MRKSTGPGLLFAVLVTCCSAPAQDSSADPSSGMDSQAWPPPAYEAVDALFESIPEAHWDESGVLTLSGPDGAEPIAIDPRTGDEMPYRPQPEAALDEARVVRPGFFAHRRPVLELPSPDYESFAGTSGGDVWLRAAGSDERRRLAAGDGGDNGFDIEGAKWSPDGRRLAIKWMDARNVPAVPLIRYGEPLEPVDSFPYSHVGEPIPSAGLFVVGRDGGQTVRIELGAMDAPYLYIVGWNASSDSLTFLRSSRFTDRVELRVADAVTGRSRLILEEESDTYIVGLPLLHGNDAQLDNGARPVRLLPDGRFLWISERDGWTRVYLYGEGGELLRPLSPEGTEVGFVAGVDAEGDWLYYTARIDAGRPYDETLMRVPLSGGEPHMIVAGPFFDMIDFDPDFEHFWTIRMGADIPPVLELYRSDGTRVREIRSSAEVSGEVGWRPPETFTAKAADGVTDLYGALYTPAGFDPSRRYPVIEDIYLGPFTSSVSRLPDGNLQALADVGFVVVTVDARNTTGRGREFGDAFYGEYGQHEIADHVAVLRQLGQERPYMDLGRVGVNGFSWGGYGVLRAMLLEPDLYRVGVAGAPAVDLEHFRVSIEPYMGCFLQDCPEAFERASSTALADRLDGKLLIMHGTSDDDVPFQETIRLITALTDAGKEYDLAVYPGGNHGIGWRTHERYYWDRMTGYFLEHLGAPTN
jgi:dipeptidyl aminopeptidase/acylaminoacyl peptidase